MTRPQLLVLAMLFAATLVALWLIVQLGFKQDWPGDSTQLIAVVLGLLVGALFVERLPDR